MSVCPHTLRRVRLVVSRKRDRSSRPLLLQLFRNGRHQPFCALARISQGPQSRIIQPRRVPDVREGKQIRRRLYVRYSASYAAKFMNQNFSSWPYHLESKKNRRYLDLISELKRHLCLPRSSHGPPASHLHRGGARQWRASTDRNSRISTT